MNFDHCNTLLQLSKASHQDLVQAVAFMAQTHQDEVLRHFPKLAQQHVNLPDFVQMKCTKVAVQLDYDGSEYAGLAFQTRPDQSYTVENLVLAALQQSYLVPKIAPQIFHFSRSGRTDSGVSGRSQVLSFYIRCENGNRTFGDLIAEQERKHVQKQNNEELSQDQIDSIKPNLEAKPCQQINLSMNYIEMINRRLPRTIRARLITPVADNFDARFSSLARSYEYVMPIIGDATDIQKVCDLFIGEKDFKNVCWRKPEVDNHVREIYQFTATLEADCIILRVRGSAFLYHQVRCMVALIALCVSGKITQDHIKKLFELNEKPFYPLAPAELLKFTGVEYSEQWGFKWQGNDRYKERDSKDDGQEVMMNIMKTRAMKGDAQGWFLDCVGCNDKRVVW